MWHRKRIIVAKVRPIRISIRWSEIVAQNIAHYYLGVDLALGFV